ncbi:hypothetical protein FA15DRAFT_606591, partial [Coprinopsis marcescibilis]
NHAPWHPFPTCSDFDFAELALGCCLNKTQIALFLQIIQRCASGEDKFTIKDYEELSHYWDSGSKVLTSFDRETVRATYDNEVKEYTFHCRPLLDWAFNLVRDPLLLRYFEWDAQRLFKYDESQQKWVHFINEPWTADLWYDIQVR